MMRACPKNIVYMFPHQVSLLQAIRETVRKEKGLSVITSLLRLPNDLVVRATAFCLRNLAIDLKNKELLGKFDI